MLHDCCLLDLTVLYYLLLYLVRKESVDKDGDRQGSSFRECYRFFICIFPDFEKWKVVYPAARNVQYILFYFCRFAVIIQRDRGDKGV